MAMTVMGARIAPLGWIQGTGRGQSMWRDFLGAVGDVRNRNVENEIVERHRPPS
jgi:hypothetical protein